MTYAIKEDIDDVYGIDLLFTIADHDNDGEVDTLAVTRALDAAAATINSYLSPRYKLPLDEVPDVLRAIAVDLTIYRLARIDTMTDEYRKRYEDAIAHLKRIGKGEAGLGVDTQDDDESGDGAGLIASSVKMIV